MSRTAFFRSTPSFLHDPLDPLLDGRREPDPQGVGDPLEKEICAAAHEDDAVIHGAIVDIGIHERHETLVFPVKPVPDRRPVLVHLVEQGYPAIALPPEIGQDPLLAHVIVSQAFGDGGPDFLSAAAEFPGYGQNRHGCESLPFWGGCDLYGWRRNGRAVISSTRSSSGPTACRSRSPRLRPGPLSRTER